MASNTRNGREFGAMYPSLPGQCAPKRADARHLLGHDTHRQHSAARIRRTQKKTADSRRANSIQSRRNCANPSSRLLGMLWVGFGPELSNFYFWESLEISSGKRPGSLLGDFRFVDLGAESLREIAPKKLREFQKVSARLVRKSFASFRKSPRDCSKKASRVSESLRLSTQKKQ